MPTLILFNKPYGVVSQFSSHPKHQSLADFIKIKEVYPAGRLDHDSEGLLILTDNGKIQHQMTDPKMKTEKAYMAQVEGTIDEEALLNLEKGVVIKGKKTRPAKCRVIHNFQEPWERVPPIRFRKEIPTSWVEIKISEGRNRQVRKMTAAVGFPTLRLIRTNIGEYSIDGIDLGTFQTIQI